MADSGSGVRLEGDWNRLRITLRQLTRLNWRGFHDAVGEVLLSSTTARFEHSRAPDGSTWKRGKKQGGKTLIDRGRLRNMGVRASDSSVVVGSNLRYSRIHQFGHDAKGMPARPYLGINDEDQAEIEGTLQDFVAEAMS